ncbi:hypothetical protein ACF0H5_003518 [Mactra antiquata]
MADVKVGKRRGSLVSDSERKKRRQEINKRYRVGQIAIGNEIDRWCDVKENMNLTSNCEVAKFLLDYYYATKDYYELVSNGTDGLLLKSRYGRHMEYEDTDVKNEMFNTNISNPDNHSLSSVEAPIYDDNVIIKTEPGSEVSDSVSRYENHEEYDKFANMIEQNAEMIAVSGNADEKKGIRTRLKSRGFRPNYASLEKWNDDILNDSDINDVGESINQTTDDIDSNFSDIDEEIRTQKAQISVNQNDSSGRKVKKKLVEDPDFEIKDLDCQTRSESETDEDSLSNYSNEDVIEEEHRKPKTKNNDKYESKQWKRSTKKVKKSLKKPWISIKLEDHPEKYRIEIVGSFERKNRGSNIVEELYTCLQCGQFKAIDKDIFEKHMENHVNGLLDCSECDFIGRSEAQIRSHKKSHGHMSNKSKKFVCDICGVVLYSRDARISHMGKVHNDPQFGCKYCDLKLATCFKRQQHVRSVHADLAQYCNICKTDFHTSTAEEYITHKSTCKPGHPCPVCGKVLVSKDGLTIHIKSTHMNVRKYQCNMCQYAAKSSQRLREHILTHTSSHPYSCDQCSFTCVQACQLTSHQRTHTGDKPYKCTQCNFAAAWNVQLKDHVKVHSMNTAVLCEPCNILFKNDKARKIHEKKDH